MPGKASSSIRPGDVDAELSNRAARRIRDYLTTHPGDDPVKIQGELAGDDALVVPRSAAVMFAQILAMLANGQGVQIMPDSAELTTPAGGRHAECFPPVLDQVAGSRGDRLPHGRQAPPDQVRGSPRVQAKG